MKTEFGKYVLPTVERLDIDIEQGFASSIDDVIGQDDGVFGESITELQNWDIEIL